jgi:hypothetical protein
MQPARNTWRPGGRHRCGCWQRANAWAGGWRDTDVIRAFFNRGAKLAQFAGHGGDTVRFLDAPAADVAQRGACPFAYKAITASVIAASGMWLQSRSMAFSGQVPRLISSQLGPLTMRRTHVLCGFNETDVALDRICAYTLEFSCHFGL